MSHVAKSLALFDFDGTLTEKDSFQVFIKYSAGVGKFIVGLLLLSPTLIFFKLGFLKSEETKIKVLRYFFKNWDEVKFMRTASAFSREKVPELIKKSAEERLKWHAKQNHKIVIVTASIRCYLEEWCTSRGFDLIATELEVEDGKITGNLSTPNCRGEEKVRRIKSLYKLDEYEHIFAYGDSPSDKYMLELANEHFYKPFR